MTEDSRLRAVEFLEPTLKRKSDAGSAALDRPFVVTLSNHDRLRRPSGA